MAHKKGNLLNHETRERYGESSGKWYLYCEGDWFRFFARWRFPTWRRFLARVSQANDWFRCENICGKVVNNGIWWEQFNHAACRFLVVCRMQWPNDGYDWYFWKDFSLEKFISSKNLPSMVWRSYLSSARLDANHRLYRSNQDIIILYSQKMSGSTSLRSGGPHSSGDSPVNFDKADTSGNSSMD